MHILNPAEYYTELHDHIPHAKHRIVLAAMVMYRYGRTGPIFDLLEKALKRGVHVHILLDVFTQLPLAEGKLWHGPAHQRKVRDLYLTFDRLKAAGATISHVGTIRPNPFMGRCHIKVTVIDDTSYSFGGVNFVAGAFDNADYMIKSTEPRIADLLAGLVRRVAASEQPYDLEQKLSDHSSLLYDAGIPKESIIYDRACRLATRAKRIHYVSQMCPSGRLAQLLRLTDSQCYFNRATQVAFPSNLALAADRRRHGIINLYEGQRYIHAKFILFELTDGTRALISGSNNFSWRGVVYGTQEIALVSTDPGLWNELYALVESFTKAS